MEVSVDDGSEVGLVQSGFNEMVAGLRQRERLHDVFGRHVGSEVAREALNRPVVLDGEQREVAVLFVDLVGSTELASRWPPERVVELLNRFFTMVVETVGRHGGWVNKFEGDAALYVFGAPLPDAGCATPALAAARELAARLGRDLPEAEAGIAVSAGTQVAGNVGAEIASSTRSSAIRSTRRARLCELAKRRRRRLLASEAVVRRARPEEGRLWRLEDAVVLRGRGEGTRVAVPAEHPTAPLEEGTAPAAAPG